MAPGVRLPTSPGTLCLVRPFLSLAGALLLAASAAAQPVSDHLKCFKVRDSAQRVPYVGDLGGHVTESGCTIKFPAVMACVPASASNVQPTPPGVGGTGVPNAFACYKVKCPKGALPPLQIDDRFGSRTVRPVKSKLVCAPSATTTSTVAGGSTTTTTTPGGGTSPILGGCAVFPPDHVFNTPIDALPVHPQSAQFIAGIGAGTNVHLDLGTQTDQQAVDYYGIPYNLVDGTAITWPAVAYASPDPELDWDPRPESDCAITSAHTSASPCTAAAAPTPLLPIPASPLVEGGVSTAADHMPYGDHHILVLDTATCRLWETYHSYLNGGTWNVFGSAMFDLGSNALRPAGWTSADAAGFPILPLLLRAEEASSGTIRHALRFTVNSIHESYVWPARHLIGGNASTNHPPMGQPFRLKADYEIPAEFNVQSRAILQAMKTYGMYLADRGSDLYVQGEPSALWMSSTFAQVQSVEASSFEAVDLSPITARAGWDVSSARVPPP